MKIKRNIFQLKKSISFLNEQKVIQVRLRSKKSGEPFEGLRKYKQYWSNTLISRLKGFKAIKSSKLIAQHIFDHPERFHSDL